MIKKKALIVGVLCCSIVVASSAREYVFAGGWSGNGDWGAGGAGANGDGGGTGSSEGIRWIKYNKNKDFSSDDPVDIVPQFRGNKLNGLAHPDLPPRISAECHKEGSSADGVWILGDTTKTNTVFTTYYHSSYKITGIDDNNQTPNVNEVWGAFIIPRAVNGGTTDTSYIDKDTKLFGIYRKSNDNYLMHYNTRSANNAGNNVVWGGTSSIVNIYQGHVDGENDYSYKLAYSTDSISVAKDKNTIVGAYKEYLRNATNSNGERMYTDEEVNAAEYQTLIDNKVFAFCSYPENQSTTLDANVHLKVDDKSIESDWDKTNDKTANKFTTHSGTVTVSSSFDFKRGVEKPSMKFYASIKKASSSKAESNSYTMNSSRLDNQSSESNITVTLSKGDNKICSYVEHPSQISSGDNSSKKNDELAKACITVTYVPITVDVHSNTIASISGGIEESNTSTTFVSGKDSFASDTVYVKAGRDVTIKWGHYIGYDADTIRPQGSTVDKVWTNTYNIYGGGKLGNGFTISKYEDPKDDFKNYWWSYLNQNYPSLFNRDFQKNEETVRLFPGENYTSKQVLKHPKTVYANTTEGGNQVGEGTGESSVELDLKANDIECWFKNGDYDIKHSIGVDNPNDYRWLQITNNNGITKTVGDDISLQNDEFWLKPESQIQIIQTACFGSQIERDAKNKNGDRWTKNPWEEITDYSNNKLFELSGDLKDSIGSSLFDNATGASKTESNVNASLTASEIGISNFSKVSNPSTRVANGYRIETASDTAVIENLGKSLYTSFSKPNRESVSITTKIPYNYYMSLNLAPDSSKGYLTSESAQFTVNIKNEERGNAQVCKDTINIDCNKYKYSTKSKKTTAGMLVFTISSEFKADDLLGKDSFSYNGNIFDSANDSLLEYRMVEAVKNHFPYGDSIQVIDRNHLKDITNKEIDDKTAESERSITSGILDLSDLAVGTKVCAVAAVYPSDSHDTGNGNPIDDSVQSAAFSPTGTKTGLKVSCRTVAKHQNMSVEGNGVVTTQRINSSTTTHNTTNDKKIFRSWSEYQIISGGSGSNASSGAVTAYALNNMAGKTENMSADPDFSSVSSGSYLYPQTLGNYSLDIIGGKKSDPNSEDESQVNWRYSETLIKNIVDTYGKGGGDCVSGDLPTSNNYLECINGGSLPYVYKEGKDTLVVKSTGTLTINNDSHLDDLSYWGSPKQLIIIAKDILIDKSVSRVNAWLIVDGGKLNTCNDYKINAPEDKSNQNLLDFCNTQLFINGPVIVNGDLILPRTFGGGSVLENGEFVKDPNTLVQRAEIFNYDPSVVEWAYRESQKNPHLETTYTETLAPRL